MASLVHPIPSTRRDFLRIVLFGPAISMVAGRAWHGTAVAGLAPLAEEMGAGLLRLRLADFPPLQGAFGSVRLGLTPLNQTGPMPPLIVTRDGDEYFVVSSECTHAGCTIPAFTAAKVSQCPCHGSRYGPDGRVLRGPAPAPLVSYLHGIDATGVMTVRLPDFPAYEVTVGGVTAPGSGRVAVEFLALRNVEYEVFGRASVAETWAVRSFALTEGGTADRTVVKGTGVPLKVFVERVGQAGFLAVGAKVQPV